MHLREIALRGRRAATFMEYGILFMIAAAIGLVAGSLFLGAHATHHIVHIAGH